VREDLQIPKTRLTPRAIVAYGAIAAMLASAGVIGVRACLPPAPPLNAAQRALEELGCAPGGFLLSAAVDDPEASWGYDCVVSDRAHAPDCDTVAAMWAKSATGLRPFDVEVRAGDPHDPRDPALCWGHYDGEGHRLSDPRDPSR
jgi:hypothetical protein